MKVVAAEGRESHEQLIAGNFLILENSGLLRSEETNFTSFFSDVFW